MIKLFLKVFFITICFLPYSLAAQKNLASNIGVCTHFDQGWSLNIMNEIAEFGCGWIRDGVNWSEVEQQRGKYKLPQRTMNWLAKAKSKRIKVLLVLAGGNKLYEDEYDKIAFSKFAKYIVLKYGDYIDAVEVLNEPNNSGFSQYYERGKATFNGVGANKTSQSWVTKYLNLLNYTAKEVKSVTRKIKVVGLGALPPTNIVQIKTGLSSYIDGITDHPYSENATFVPYANNDEFKQRDNWVLGDKKGTYYSYIKGYQSLLTMYKKTNRQIWISEFGYSTSDKNMIDNPDKEIIQASSLSKRIIESFSLAVDKMFIYCFRDNCHDIANKECGFGLRKTDGTQKASLAIIKRLFVEMNSFTNRKNTDIMFEKESSIIVNDFKNNDRFRVYSFFINGIKTYYLWSTNGAVLKTVYIKGVKDGSVKISAKNILTDKAITFRINKASNSVLFVNNQSADNIIKLTVN